MLNLYDPEGLNLYYPDYGNDLILEYSIDDGNTWNFLENVSTGGTMKERVEAERVILTVEDIPGVYKLRLRHINYVQGQQNYAIDEMYFTGSYAFDGIRPVDRAETRREAWHVELRDKSINLRSHAFWESPPAYWTRDGRTKRPVNIQNIKVSSLGNYKDSYEVVQTSGRRITNNLIVDGFIAGGVLATQFINYKPPLLSQTEPYTLEENFSSFTPLQPVNNEDLESSTGDLVKVGSIDPYVDRKFLVLANTIANSRHLSFKTIFTGSSTITVTSLHNPGADTYDSAGLVLEHPDSTDNLYLQYSLDGTTWTNYSTLVTGSAILGPTTVEEKTTVTTVNTIQQPYYLRFSQTYSPGAFDQYALTDIKVNATSFIPGEEAINEPYFLPELNKVNGSRSVIVERFNAPGSKEESSRGALDREGEEISPNIPLPFRNIKIRQPFYRQLAQHNPQFGSGSTYALLPDTGIVDAVTIHKINRNRLPGNDSINDFFDNGYVTNAIPRTDIQYSWITASSTTTSAELRGYQSFRTSTYNRNMAFDDIDFITGSVILDEFKKEHFVDNLFINSLIKDQKSVDTETNTYSIQPTLQASLAEAVNTPYTFTSWVSMRLGDLPVPRKLKKDNIISLLDSPNISIRKEGANIYGYSPRRGWTTTNLQEPTITFKYRPLEHHIKFGENGDLYQIDNEYVNTISLFANKEVTQKLDLLDKENKKTFYDYFLYKYKKPQISNMFYQGHKYKEIIWPKEERTGLSQTRKREAYYLDKPGFDRDGYDRQLGTQRVFWREKQQDRKRSNNTDGGYYSSMGYLSTEETGSSFYVEGDTKLIDGNDYTYISNYKQYDSIDTGLYNSIAFMESNSSENLIFTSSLQILDNPDPLLYIKDQKNISYKKSYKGSILGESNNIYVDSYGISKVSGSNTLRDLGAIYRNNIYKSLLSTTTEESQQGDKIIIVDTEDDQIKINPKLKYTSFTGGGELNISDYVQQNFTDNSSILDNKKYIFENDKVISLDVPSDYGLSEIFEFSEDFRTVVFGNKAAEGHRGTFRIWKKWGDNWVLEKEEIGSIAGNESSYPSALGSSVGVSIDGKRVFVSEYNAGTNNPLNGKVRIYVSGSGGWNLESTLTGQNDELLGLYHKDNPIAIGEEYRSFIQFAKPKNICPTDNSGTTIVIGAPNGGANNQGHFHIYTLSGGSWQKIYTIVNNNLETNAAFGTQIRYNGYLDYLYVSAPGLLYTSTTPEWFTANPPGKYVFIYNLGTLQIEQEIRKEDILGGFFGISLDVDEYGNNLAVGSRFELAIYKKSNIYTFSSKHSEFLEDLEQAYFSGITSVYFSTQSRFLSIEGYGAGVGGAAFRNYIYGSGSIGYVIYKDESMDNYSYINNRYIGTDTAIVYNTRGYISEEKITIRSDNEYIGSDLFETEFTHDDILFSTLDNGLLRTTEADSGKKPFFDSYEEYLQDIYPLTKEYSVVPEFRISENIEDYITSESFWNKSSPRISLDGADKDDYELYKNGTSNLQFASQYCTSDILKKYDNLLQDNKDISELDSVSIKVSGITKLLPYNGLYPQDRITQIANKYDKFVDDNLAGGVLNISYEQKSVDKFITNHIENDLGSGEIRIMETIEFAGKVYTALSYPKSDNNVGLVKIFSSSVDMSDQETWSIPSFLELKGENPGDNFGQEIKFATSSYGLDLFISAPGASSGYGQVYIKSSTNGIDWSLPIEKPSELRGNVGSSYEFGYSFDVVSHSDELYICISEPKNGILKFSSAQYQGGKWSWQTIKNITNNYSQYYDIGRSISMLVAVENETPYVYIYASSPTNQYDLPGNIWGQIHRFKSSPTDITDFSGYSQYSQTKILDAIYTTDGAGIGTGKIKAVEYYSDVYGENVHYLFYQLPDLFLAGGAVQQKIMVAFSPSNWLFGNTVKQELISEHRCERDSISRSILDAKVVGNELHYSFVSGEAVYSGKTKDGFTFTNNGLLSKTEKNAIPKTVSIYDSNYNNIQYTVNTSNDSLYVSYFDQQSIVLNVYSSGSSVEKAWKHAASEPLFGPGIVYNTVKSGIAVDWPCLTGSVAYRKLDNGVVINPFYPCTKQMKGFSGTNGFYNINGSIRNEINYRVPFDNILYPQEIFTEKSEISANIREEYLPNQSIPTNSAITELINNCYIYGGYETYTIPTDVGDIDGQTAKRFSVPFVYSKGNIRDSGLYTLAMNNFMAEAVNFFLEEGKMATFESKPDNEWPEFKAGVSYYMDVVLQKSSDLVMMEAWSSDKHPIGDNGQKMDGRYFGYPVNKTTKDLWEGQEFTERERELIHNDPAYAPYTPPYFEGAAKARLSFTPEVDGKYSVTQVIESIVIEDIFVEAAKGWKYGSPAHVNKMSVAESIDFTGISKVVRSEIRSRGESVETTVLTELPENKKWVISPRFETPVLDFSDQEFVSYEKNYLKTSGYGRGMWSGYGKIPEGSKGIFLGLSYPFNSKFLGYSRQQNTRSLLKHVGFKTQRKKIGKISTKNKTIRESVVLVPYLEKYNVEYNDSNLKLGENIYPIKISKSEYQQQMDRVESGRNASGEKQTTSITRMVESLKKYVIPPEMNFIDNNSLSPFAMYLFEFERELSPQDLADIWQGLMPSISHDAEVQEIEITHASEQDEIFHGKPIPQNLRWLVFRVKQKAIYDYGKVTSSTKDDQRFAQNTIVGKSDFPYSYNWPYDYFSLVEFAKVEMELSYKKK